MSRSSSNRPRATDLSSSVERTLLEALKKLPRYRVTGRYGGAIQCEGVSTGEWVRWSDVDQVVAHAEAPQAPRPETPEGLCTACSTEYCDEHAAMTHRKSSIDPEILILEDHDGGDWALCRVKYFDEVMKRHDELLSALVGLRALIHDFGVQDADDSWREAVDRADALIAPQAPRQDKNAD